MTETNEIALLPKVTFTPAKFEVTNLDELTDKVKAIISAHKDEIITEENEAQAIEDRKQLEDFKDNLSRKRIDTEHELLKEFTPKKKELMKLEKDVAKAADDIKQQTDVFKQKRHAEKLAALRKLIQSFIDEKTKAAGVDPLKIVWSENWNKAATSQKQIKSDIDEQISRIVAEAKAKEAEAHMIELIGEQLSLDPKAYLQMLDDKPFEVVKSRMEATAADKKRILAEAEAREQKQREQEKQKAEQMAIAEAEAEKRNLQRDEPQQTDDAGEKDVAGNNSKTTENVTQGQTEPNTKSEYKDKYIKLHVNGPQWKFALAQLRILKENGIDITIVEPAKKA